MDDSGAVREFEGDSYRVAGRKARGCSVAALKLVRFLPPITATVLWCS